MGWSLANSLFSLFSFKEIWKGWWQSLQFHGSYSFILAAKLKALKGILKVWIREVFGKVETKKKDAL